VKEFWSRLTTAFGNLSARERMLVASAGFLTGLTLIYFALVVPVIGVGNRAAMRLDAAQTQYQVVKRLRIEYDDVQQRLRGIESRIKRGSRGSLRTKLETLAQTSNVTIESMEPQMAPSNDRYRETKVEVGLKGVTLPQAVTYLNGIETSGELLTVKRLRVRTRADKPELLDVVFTVSSFERI
jgi:type II secretory pathway component PulM